MAAKSTALKRMAPKKHFLVFCTIFLTVVVLLGLGAWRTQVEIERRGAAGRNDAPSLEPEAAPAPPSIRRLADPPPPGVSTDER